MFRKKGIIIVLVGVGILTFCFGGVEPVYASNQDKIDKAKKILEKHMENLKGDMTGKIKEFPRKGFYPYYLTRVNIIVSKDEFPKKGERIPWSLWGIYTWMPSIVNSISDALAKDDNLDESKLVSKSSGKAIYINERRIKDLKPEELAAVILWEMVLMAQRLGYEYRGAYYFTKPAKKYPVFDVHLPPYFVPAGILNMANLYGSLPKPLDEKVVRIIGSSPTIEYPGNGDPAFWKMPKSKKYEARKIKGKWQTRKVDGPDKKDKGEWKPISSLFDLWGSLPPERTIPQKFGIEGNYAYCMGRMDKVNDYIDWINNTWGGDIPKIDHANVFSIKGVYRTSPHSGFSLGGESFRIETSGMSAPPLKFKLGSSVWGVFTGFFSEYPPDVIDKLDLGVDIEIGYYWADYVEEENGWRQDGNDSSVGYKIAVKAKYPLTENFHIKGDIGYRGLKMDNFDVNFVSPGNPLVELDYSGWFVGIAILYNWDDQIKIENKLEGGKKE